MSKTLARFICPECGSNNIKRDASAVWSEPDQCWEIADVYDRMVWCGDCSHEERDDDNFRKDGGKR